MATIHATGVAAPRRGRGRRTGIRSWLPGWAYYTICSLIALMFLAPLVWTLLGSIKPRDEANAAPPTYFPSGVETGSYAQLQDVGVGVGTYVLNSVVVTAGSVVLVTVLSVLAGYGFARFPFKGQSLLFLLILATLMVPFQSILTPLFLVLRELGLTNTLLGLILIYTTFELPFALFMMRNAFSQVPKSLEEAALLDGATTMGVLRRIMLPIALPGVVTVILYAFFNSWNEYLAALIFVTSEENYTLPVLLTSIQAGQYGTINWGILQAGVVLTMAPCIIIFLILQRYYISGLVAGATKG